MKQHKTLNTEEMPLRSEARGEHQNGDWFQRCAPADNSSLSESVANAVCRHER